MPGKVADFLRAAELGPAERAALDQGATVRRGQGYTLRVPAVPAVHRRLLDLCQPSTAPRQSRPSARPAASRGLRNIRVRSCAKGSSGWLVL